MSVVAVVPAAGSGARLAAGVPKALVALAGESLVSRAVTGLLESGRVDAVVVVAPPGYEPQMRAALPGAVTVVPGGADRTDSVRRALDALPEGTEVVLVHDAARCLTPASVVAAVVDAVRAGRRAVVPVLPVSDTLKRTDERGEVTATVDRCGLVAVQTPQGFAVDVLRRAYAATGSASASDDAGLVERLDEPVTTVPGDPRALKITTPLDLTLAAVLVGASSMPVSPP